MCLNRTSSDDSDVLHSRFTGQCPDDGKVCCARDDNLERLAPSGCGIRNKNGVGFQVVDSLDEAQFGEFPWMMALMENKDSNRSYICGASLLHPSVILTAAHCVNSWEVADLKAIAGEWDTQTTNEILPMTEHGVARKIVHAEFGPANLFNDVALLVLDTPVELGAHINTICLPPQNFKFDEKVCFASGWGAKKFGRDGAYRVNLKKIELPVVGAKKCQDSLRTTKLGARFKLNPSFMCAGGEANVDTCTGKLIRIAEIFVSKSSPAQATAALRSCARSTASKILITKLGSSLGALSAVRKAFQVFTPTSPSIATGSTSRWATWATAPAVILFEKALNKTYQFHRNNRLCW